MYTTALMVILNILSINSGGSNSLVQNPSQQIEGFFFGYQFPTGPGSLGDITKSSFDAGDVCSFSEQFIQNHVQDDGTLSFVKSEIDALADIFLVKEARYIPPEVLEEIIRNECEIPSPFIDFFPLLLLLLIILVIAAISQRKRISTFLGNVYKEKSA